MKEPHENPTVVQEIFDEEPEEVHEVCVDPPVQTHEGDAGTHEKPAQTDGKPSETQENQEDPMDLGNDQLELESNVEKDVQAHTVDQLPPHQEEGLMRTARRTRSRHTRTRKNMKARHGKAAWETRRGRGMPSMRRSIPRSDKCGEPIRPPLNLIRRVLPSGATHL